MNANIFEHISYVAHFFCTALFMAQALQTPEDGQSLRTVEYNGIRPSDPGGRNGLCNPERGLRIETLIAEPSEAKVWGPVHHLKGKVTPGYDDQWWMLDAQRYEPYGLTLAQTYCYLDKFVGKPISEEKLSLLQKSFDNVRKRGLKAVLRFAYEKDMNRRGGPTLENILNHIEQLAPIIRKNADIIFVMQAGFVGAWGEWHSSTHGLENDHEALAAIIAKVLDTLPADRMTQVRVPKYKRWVLSQPILGGHQVVDDQIAHTSAPAARIGFNNDGFLAGQTCGGTWPEEPYFSNLNNPEFDYMTDESPYIPVDGELFWSDQGGKVDGLRAAIRMRLHHYSSFSLVERGKHIIKVCDGTACHLRGAVNLRDEISRHLGISAGETTADKMFTLETVACLGACALAPVMAVGSQYHGQLTSEKARQTLDEYRDAAVTEVTG